MNHMSDAFAVIAKNAGREKRVPYGVSIDPFYQDSNIRYLKQKLADYRVGKLKLAEHGLIED